MFRILLAALTLSLSLAASPAGDKSAEQLEVPANVKIEAGTSRAWAMAACALPFQVGGLGHDLLSGVACDAQSVKSMRGRLEIEFKVKRRIELVNVLDELMENGRQAQFKQFMKEVRELKLTDADIDDIYKTEPQRILMRAIVKHAPRMSKEKDGILAYDCMRYMELCRYGYAAGYLTDEETWRRLDSMARKLQKAYTSFEQAGEIYSIGVEVFANEMTTRTSDAFNLLKRDEKSPWKSVAWGLKLNPLDKPEPKKPADPVRPK
jgi:hypothetical protein